MSEHEYNDAMSRLWKAEAEIERLRNDYEIQMRKTDAAQLECERLRAALLDILSVDRSWNDMKDIACKALDANEQNGVSDG